MKKTIRDFDLSNKKVIIRCDFNVPIKDGEIVDDNRIVQSLTTINYAINNGAKVILMSHLGRIKEEADKEKNSLRIVAQSLSNYLGREVKFCPVTRGPELEGLVNSLNPGDVLLMENTRFEDVPDKKESGNDPELGAYWASLGEVFINDAFGTAHRAHASNVGIASHLPSGLGFLVEKEFNALSVLTEPAHPYVVILGGSKVADKIGVIENLVKKADKILIGGGMAYTFLKAKGVNIGKSILDEENVEFCKKVLSEYPDKIVLPIDNVVTKEYSNDVEFHSCDIENIMEDEMGLDIGEKTVSLFSSILDTAKTVFWNGPLGVYEFSNFTKGTLGVLNKLVNIEATTILGGGDIVAAATKLNYKERVTHASTGGGVTLEFMEGKELPGVTSISDK